MEFTHIDEKGKVRMVDVSNKEVIFREAKAEGLIKLRKKTINAIINNEIAKGDVLTTANIAAVIAVKKTFEIIPMCHPLPITGVKLEFDVQKDHIKVTCTVKCYAKTGVEMEALTGVSVALLTIWDMVKSMEKVDGEYPFTSIQYIKVIEKFKGQK